MKWKSGIIVILLAIGSFPTLGHCQFPWNALNNTINQFNQSVALQQNEQALRIQQEYLRQQAVELNRRNQLMQQELEMKNRAVPQASKGFSDQESLSCLKERESLKDFADITDKSSEITFNWKYNWEKLDPEFKKRLFYTIVYVDTCASQKPRKVSVYQNGTLVAVADPTTRRVEILK